MTVPKTIQPNYYAIREVIASQKPETQGPLLAIKRTWDEAVEYRDKLYKENDIRSYISEWKIKRII